MISMIPIVREVNDDQLIVEYRNELFMIEFHEFHYAGLPFTRKLNQGQLSHDQLVASRHP